MNRRPECPNPFSIWSRSGPVQPPPHTPVLRLIVVLNTKYSGYGRVVITFRTSVNLFIRFLCLRRPGVKSELSFLRQDNPYHYTGRFWYKTLRGTTISVHCQN